MDRTEITRRNFLIGASALSAASLLGISRRASAEPPPETTRVRLILAPSMCLAPQYLAEELLRLEGFSAVEYLPIDARPDVPTIPALLSAGLADFSMGSAPSVLPFLDEDKPLLVLAGIHAGCYELFVNERVKAIRDLKGKKIAASQYDDERIFISSTLAYVGMDPRQDVRWVTTASFQKSMQLFIEGKVDAFLAFPPQPQEMRAKKLGRVILNTAQDRPWSQYFCCMLNGNRDFVEKHPVATKRVVRAFLKAADICAQEPERAARLLVARGYEPRYDLALEILKGLPYRRWRDTHPEDTLRFHALRLHEAGMIKSTPQKLIAQGTDWRFLNELKKELKA
jgi:NitT/TauT family transport system substrate-binding protein